MEERKEARRRSFLEVGIRLFGSLGYHATTVPAVVQAAGASTGSFYFYFKNKEDLFVNALLEIERRLSESLNEAIADETEVPLQMRAAVTRLFTYLAEHPDEARILLIDTAGLGESIEKVRKMVVASHTISVKNALDRVGLNEQDTDTLILGRCWVGAVYEAVRYWLELPVQDRQSPMQVASQVANFNLRGVGISL